MEDERKTKEKKKPIQVDRGSLLHPAHWNLRVDIYLRLELHHVCFYLHVGFVQILNFVIQMFNILLVFNTCVNQSVSFSTSQLKKTSTFPLQIQLRAWFLFSFVFVPLVWSISASLPLLAFSLIVISSSECFFLILCAFSGHPDKLVVDDFRSGGKSGRGGGGGVKNLNMNAEMKEAPFQANQREAWQNCWEINGKTMELTFCEWQTHYWHVQGRCSQAGDNGAVPVYWPSRQRAAH